MIKNKALLFGSGILSYLADRYEEIKYTNKPFFMVIRPKINGLTFFMNISNCQLFHQPLRKSLIGDSYFNIFSEVIVSFLCSLCSNLYKIHGLLSIQGNPVPHHPHHQNIPNVRDAGSDRHQGAEPGWERIPGEHPHISDATSYFPVIAFLGMAFVLIFLVNHVYNKKKNRPKKARRVKRKHRSLFSGKMPGV